jgi:hypothetical protein
MKKSMRRKGSKKKRSITRRTKSYKKTSYW